MTVRRAADDGSLSVLDRRVWYTGTRPESATSGGGIIVAVTAPQAGASSEFTLGSHLTNIEFITAQAGQSTSFPASPMVPGDRLMTRDDLTQTESPVG